LAPGDLCHSKHVWQRAEAVVEHRDELNHKDGTETDEKQQTNRF
jgi:hypothetical protein